MAKRSHKDVKELIEESKPRKFQKTALPNTVHSKYISPTPNTCPPYIVHFPHGPPSLEVLRSNDQLNITSYSNVQDQRKKHQQIIVAETEKMEYKGKNFGEDARSNVSKYLIGVYNKKMGTLDLVDSPTVFSMEQRVKNMKIKSQPNIQQNLDFAAKRNLLVETFGSKRLRKSHRSTTEHAVTTNSTTDDVSDEIKKVLEDKAKVQREDVPNINMYPDLPPANFETTNAEEIYPIDQIFETEEAELLPSKEMLHAYASPVKLKEFIDQYQLPEYLHNFLSTEDWKHSSKQQKRKLAPILLYLSYLIVFKRSFKAIQRTKDKSELEELVKIPPTLLYKFISMFSERKNNGRIDASKRHHTKLLNYILVLYLTVNNFKGSVDAIAQVLKLPSQNCALYFRRIGCTTLYQQEEHSIDEAVQSSSVSYARLQAPLKIAGENRRVTNKLPQSMWK